MYREPMGIDSIKERLGQALAGGAHPRRIKLVRFPLHQKKSHPKGWWNI